MKRLTINSLNISPSLLCVGLFTVWWILLPYNQNVFGDGGNEIIVSNASRAIFPFLGAYLVTKNRRAAKPLNSAMVVLMSVFGFLFFSRLIPMAEGASLACLSVASMASGWLFISWSKPFVERDLDSSAIHYCLAMALASILVFILSFVPRELLSIVVGIIPLVIYIAYRRSLETTSDFEASDIEPEKIITRNFIIRWGTAIFLYGIVWGIMQSLPFGTYDYSPVEIAVYRLLSILSTASLPFIVFVLKRKLPLDGLLITIIAASAICILATIVSGFRLATPISIAYASINYLIHPFCWIFLTYFSQKRKLNCYYVFSIGWGLLLIANVLGHFFTKALAGIEDSGYIIGSVALFILFVSILVLIAPKSLESASPETANFIISPPSFLMNINMYRADAIKQVAQEYKLTQKEEKIVSMLAQGRTFQYCADIMHLSINTIGAYVKTIYAKCDVHAKEELLDIIDLHVNEIVEENRE